MVCLAAAAALLYVHHAVFDSAQFSARATAVLRDDRARSAIADRVTAQLLRAEPDLLAARPLIAAVVSGVIGSRPFTNVFRAGVADVHRAVFTGDEDTITLTLADAGTVVADALAAVRPALARKVPRGRRVVLLRQQLTGIGAEVSRIAGRTLAAAIVLLVLGVLGALAAVALTPDRREAIFRLALRLAVAGAVLGVLAAAARALLLGLVATDDRDAAAAVWDAFGAGLGRLGWSVAVVGAVAAAGARATLTPAAVRDLVRRGTQAAAREPRTRRGQVGRIVLLLGAGAVSLADPGGVLRLLVSAAGVLLAALGVSALLDLVAPARARSPEPETSERPPPHPDRRRAWVAGALVAAVGATLAVALLRSDEVTRAVAARAGTCNGSRALCDRTLPQVALLATHNAMSIPGRDWFSAEQDGTIAQQLDYGVRGLLIDTWYADRLPNGRLRTEIPEGKLAGDAISPAGRRAALRLRDRTGLRGEGERGLYLCHTFCELGATPLADGLDAIASFLVANPEQVLVMINQDAISPKDFVGAMREAGLDRFALTPPKPGGRWPTLRRMIDTGRRLLVLAEERGGAAPWYRTGYDGLLMETPYTFGSVRALADPKTRARTCRPNRGGTKAPLFLMNHWVSTDPVPRPSDAAKVNATRVLLPRAETCRRVRDHIPNLVAVNFAEQGDARAVVDRLNGVTPGR